MTNTDADNKRAFQPQPNWYVWFVVVVGGAIAFLGYFMMIFN